MGHRNLGRDVPSGTTQGKICPFLQLLDAQASF